MRHLNVLTLVLCLAYFWLVGCGGDLLRTFEDSLPDDEVLYKSDSRGTKLEVPPGFDTAKIEDSLEIPGEREETTLSEYQGTQPGLPRSKTSVLARMKSSARIERDGDRRWLAVEATPGEVWLRVRSVFLDNGLTIGREDPALGVIETAWAERREALPLNPVSRFLSRINKTAYSFATRDKFRAQLEHGEPGTIEVYISHRGAQEQSQGGNYVWTPRPSDPLFEAEILGRLMMAFGAEEGLTPKEVLDKVVLNEDVDTELAPAQAAYLVHTDDGRILLSFEGGFTQAWWRTNLVLDSSGFTIKDRDRSRGLFFVRYIVESEVTEEKKGLFAKLKFWEKEEPLNDEFLIRLTRSGEVTDIFVFDTQGDYADQEVTERILSLLHKKLNQEVN